MSLQLWLFGYELADTLCVFCANEIHILSSKKKIDFIKPLEEVLAGRAELPKLKLYTRNKVLCFIPPPQFSWFHCVLSHCSSFS